ncbi:MAG: ornithine carbamoyltransferase [Candidatus Marinimicrobia bacterium]|nr:ornithine carbamoyltransferase [Candidatus Neomarinimicrobiota bacterium]
MKRDFIHITDFTGEEIHQTLNLAAKVKRSIKNGERFLPLRYKTMAMIFAKPSTRTRVSFETGMEQLGGHAIFLGPNDIGIGKREAIKDIARVISRYDDIIMARLFDHEHIKELAEYSSVPVINGLTDFNHPCQIMADIMTIQEHRGDLNDLKVAFIGDGNNVAHSWINLAARLSMHFAIATPEGFEPDTEVVKKAREEGLSKIDVVRDPEEAVEDADIIYTDVWASMGEEDQAAEKKKKFQNYQISKELLKRAKDNYYVMHCLPAHRGEEITDKVMESKRSIVFDEAENRMHAQKAIILKLMEIEY